jgi:hypothetical protein
MGNLLKAAVIAIVLFEICAYVAAKALVWNFHLHGLY